jgi:hypothetical protein
MITKSLIGLEEEKALFEKKLLNEENLEEREKLTKEFYGGLKLYLFETKNVIKRNLHADLTPFKNHSYTHGVFTKTTHNEIVKKTKSEFFKEIDDLSRSTMYLALDDEIKREVNNGFWVLKTYYEDQLEDEKTE